ncbi:4-(cytidine 5'-diphospho)-2-C-methyl-D-erythritol kinase [Rhizobium sp. TH2]|uniref:4-(cytidine 5'-diphospho)-2-C-methyl-D-erythritol kinase n=1 Tax=Rhizobium sp. TH2 TaxID=2775403 RepID=UPI0021576C85|nr:4-(cytidine 5'-diphospho)-2-C-methyl-D-erythritol kinase [Rhizobium sp. TH2]
MAPGETEEFAAAKINLALHVTGQRADGYHLLDSLVVFADAGDRLTFSPSEEDRFTVSGRFGGSLPLDSEPKTGNLVLRARDALRARAAARGNSAPPVHIHLEKNLPVASGIGGGSADAAAALRGLARFWATGTDRPSLHAIGLALGADVPMCIESQPLLARGIGEDITLLGDFPKLHLLLVNPLVEVSTPEIFKRLTNKNNPPLDVPRDGAPREQWIGTLGATRNDLQPSAETLEPVISDTLELIRTVDPMLARMSGSGATCFGVYQTRTGMERAWAKLEAERPDWYVQGCKTI